MNYNHTTNLHWDIIMDNAGTYHISVMDNLTNTCIYSYSGTREDVSTLHAELKQNAHPINDYWEGSDEHPETEHNLLVRWVIERMGGAWEIDIDEEAE